MNEYSTNKIYNTINIFRHVNEIMKACESRVNQKPM